MHPASPSITANAETHDLPTQLANKEISNSFWKNLKITLEYQINVLTYCTGTVYTQKHANRFKKSSIAACCTLCGETNSINHVALRHPNSTMSGMHTKRYHASLSFCVKTLSEGRYGSPLISMDARRNDTKKTALRSLKTCPEFSHTGFLLMVLAPLPGTNAALI
eukprot:scaffold145395_cov18-Tisochrysis_lutea.AAC.2